MQGAPGTSTPAKLVSAAFPALQRLELAGLSLSWQDLHALAACPQLFSLDVEVCALPAPAPATNPLTALTSLRELHVKESNITLACGLPQVTSLCLHSRMEHLSSIIVPCMCGMQQLRQLKLLGRDSYLPAAVAAQLFSALPNLEGFTLLNTIWQPEFDALLAHATQLTRLTCLGLYLSGDRSQSACSWKELVVSGFCCIPRLLADLPVHSLSRLCLTEDLDQFNIPSACPFLSCRLGPHSIWECTPAALQAALTNLATCPAWQASGPSVRITLGSSVKVQEGRRLPTGDISAGSCG
jgi:hypothetical protein